ncbi:MAG: hypothetical protein Q7R39_10395 [Dehalococcoidia bacterium]|nr:hypothetical protein [Dehalococcoidia bacterium]
MDDIEGGAYLVENPNRQNHRRASAICDRQADADIRFLCAAVLAVFERLNQTQAG